MSFYSIIEHCSIKAYADKLGLNSSIVAKCLREYIQRSQSSFKLELENISLKELNKINKQVQNEKDKLAKELEKNIFLKSLTVLINKIVE